MVTWVPPVLKMEERSLEIAIKGTKRLVLLVSLFALTFQASGTGAYYQQLLLGALFTCCCYWVQWEDYREREKKRNKGKTGVLDSNYVIDLERN